MRSWQYAIGPRHPMASRVRFLLALGCVCACWPVTLLANWYQDVQAIMGTEVKVELWSEDPVVARSSLRDVMAWMRSVDEQMSPYRESSEVSVLNREAAQRAVPVSENLFNVLEQALQHGAESQGAFDITFASVGHQVDYRSGQHPDADQLATLRRLIDYRSVTLDRDALTVRFAHPGTRIDLGGIAKGYAVDVAIDLLKARGIRHALVKAGGDSRLLGDRRGRPWWLGVKHPRGDGYLVRFPAVDQAISTSGDYERFFIDAEGQRHHHILLPETGLSAQGIQSVTVLADNATLSDALSTTLFVMGVDRGLRYIKRFPQVSAIMIDAQGQIFYSDDLIQAQDSTAPSATDLPRDQGEQHYAPAQHRQ